MTLDTPAFQGDVLAVNNEQYNACTDPDDPAGYGGFDLYDVTEPARRRRSWCRAWATPATRASWRATSRRANSSHSTFVWQGNDRRAYVVFVDNVELHDVDIFEITDPADPQPVAEYDLVELAADQGVDIIDELSLGGLADIFLHDMVVKKIGDRFIMLADYWDAGYVTLDVTNPADPAVHRRLDVRRARSAHRHGPAGGQRSPGRVLARQQVHPRGRRGLQPVPARHFEITTGPNAGAYDAGPVGGGASPTFLPDRRLNGPTVYGGYGCDASTPIPPRATVRAAAARPRRGGDRRPPARPVAAIPDNPEAACFPGEKAENGINAGYDAVLLTNHHAGEAQGVFCGSGDFPATPPIVTVCTTHEALHTIFGEPSSTTVPYPPGHGPPLGDLGEKVEPTAVFDGWGYTHLIENDGRQADDGRHVRDRGVAEPALLVRLRRPLGPRVRDRPDRRTSRTARTTRPACGCSPSGRAA